MKYIRTKDSIGTGIFEVQEEHFTKEQNKEQVLVEVTTKETMTNPVMRFIPKQIEKYADTIEELCDAFIVAYENGARIIYSDLEWAKEKTKRSLEVGNKSVIYGAIWTDKGLIYVAEMKGVLPNGEIDWRLL